MASILPQFEMDASMSPQTAPKIAPSLYLRPYPGNMPPSGSLAKCPISARCGICYTEHFTSSLRSIIAGRVWLLCDMRKAVTLAP
jgi:hypothetical protein